jgi:hypothetical protein
MQTQFLISRASEEEEDVVQFQFPDIYVGPLNVSEEDEEEEESGEDGEEEDEE